MMKMSFRILILATGLLAVASATQAVERYVAWDNAANAASPFTSWATAATNIQDAVDVAQDNDVIWVAPGTYGVSTNAGVYEGVTNIVHITKGLELRSSDGAPAQTIIDGNGSFRGMYLYPPAAQRILVDGFTVRNCVATNGAGIYIEPMNTRTAVVQNCVIEYNTAIVSGGGISILKGNNRSFDYMISNSVIRANQALTGPGGGIADGGSRAARSAIITDSLIVSNSASNFGGGIYLYVPATDLSLIKNCEIAYNSSGFRGGGIFHGYGSTTVRNSLIHDNTASSWGGGIMVLNSAWRRFDIQNCTIANNTGSPGSGVGVQNSEHYITFWNTIVNNDSIANTAIQAYTNCILDPAIIHATGTNIIFTNTPGFADAANQNYRLASGSVGINAGTNQSWMAGAVDLDGNRRVDGVSNTVDMGAYEYVFAGTTILVR